MNTEKTEFVQKYINKMKKFQELILNLVNNDSTDILSTDLNINLENHHEIRLALHIISQISIYHHRTPNFFDKIKKILGILKEGIIKHLSNNEIAYIFKKSLPIFIFLCEEKIIIPNSSIYYSYISFNEYFQFLIPEFKILFNESEYESYYSNIFEQMKTEAFEEKRRKGENDSYLCELIRNDSIKELIMFCNQTNLQILDAKIKKSYFETNCFLIEKKNISLIEYAAFFGSIQIFNYLRLNGAEVTSSLWNFAIHSNNPEMIQILEESKVKPNNDIFNEAIKCHHNEIALYVQENLANVNRNDSKRLQFYNFSVFSQFFDDDFLSDKNKRNNLFYDFCNNDCFELVEYFLNNIEIDINARIILNEVLLNRIFINSF